MTSRRLFLRMFAGGALPIVGALQRPFPPKRVIVLGAGLAGLAAAYELRRGGHDVIVLEAQAIPGGRVRTLRDGFDDGLYAETGGQSFYPVPENYASKYAEEFGLRLLPRATTTLRPLWHFAGTTIRDGSPIVWPSGLTAADQQLGVDGLRDKYLSPVVEKLAVLLDPRHEAWPTEAVDQFDRFSFAELLRRRGASRAVIDLLRITDMDTVGEGPDEYSALDMLGLGYNVRAAARFLKGPFFSIAGGNDLLPRAFAARLGDRIRYKAVVQRLRRSDSSVSIDYQLSGRHESITGDYAVCTIPFSVLRSLDVAPAFSSQKTTAIRDLPYVSLARTFIQCRRRFWQEQGLSGRASTDLATTYFWESTAGQPGARGILQGFIMGQHARRFGSMSSTSRRRFAIDQATQVFPEAAAHAETVASIDWDHEPFNRGAYAFFRPGQGRSLFPHLATPEGPVHFAGEHTSTWFLHGSLQGALESGIRVARAINSLARSA